MDFLKAEIAQKRKAVEDSRVEGPAAKYMRRGEEDQIRIRRDREEKEKTLALAEAKLEILQRGKSTSRAGSSNGGTPAPDTPNNEPNPNPGASFNISNDETIRRLRSKGQPIRLFGETDKDRRLRLRALELIEERGGPDKAGLNDFRKALEDVEEGERRAEDAANKAKNSGKGDANGGAAGASGAAGAGGADGGRTGNESKEEGLGRPLDLGLIKSDPNKLYPLIYHALKRALKEWGEWLDERPDSVKRTMAGKLAAANQVRTIDYMKPLFKSLRARDLGDTDKLARIAEIVHHMQARQYQRANDAYLRLSIGTSAWPIGVTMVGIHERSAREKISTDQVAHVLNDEVSRKYIQSLKRLLTFAQTKYPPEDISQLMG